MGIEMKAFDVTGGKIKYTKNILNLKVLDGMLKRICGTNTPKGDIGQ